MLYNSFEFILLFLPVTLAVFYTLAALRMGRAALFSLVVASLFFYAYWDWYGQKDPSVAHVGEGWNYVWLLLGSILINYSMGAVLRVRKSKGALVFGIAVNLLALGYFKYANFFIGTVASVIGAKVPALSVVLPLGISFFTFTQIAFLVDCYKGLAEELNFNRYCLFVTFFPHLIAGPIVHHRDIMGQFAEPGSRRWVPENVHAGIVLFVLGLFKKVAIADTVGPWAGAVFDSAAAPNFVEAWSGALAYTFQLYFDFSGYSDMAIGLALLFNIRMPDNFDAPYRSRSIVEFWSRWHITLSRFLRDYLYIPLGGNRKGEGRRYVNLMITMFLGGLWHGAGWVFILWGVYHGALLSVAHWWRGRGGATPEWAGRAATFVAVVVGWVLFRAGSIPGVGPVEALGRAGGILGAMVRPWEITAAGAKEMMPAGGNQWLVLAGLLAFVNLAPTSRQWLESREMTRGHAVALAGVFLVAMLLIRDALLSDAPNLFIYFQF